MRFDLKKIATRVTLALCLFGSLAVEMPKVAEAAPLAGLSQSAPSVEASAANPATQVQYYRRHYYRPRYYRPRYYRPIYRPIYRPLMCRRVVGWHRTPYGMVFGPYRRCFR